MMRALALLVDLVTMDLIQAAILSHLKNLVSNEELSGSLSLAPYSFEPSDSNEEAMRRQ